MVVFCEIGSNEFVYFKRREGLLDLDAPLFVPTPSSYPPDFFDDSTTLSPSI
jgi:hypothetical protein